LNRWCQGVGHPEQDVKLLINLNEGYKMELFTFVFLTLFAHDNRDYFETVEQNQNDGMSFHYVGKTEVTGDTPALPIIIGDKEYYWWKMK